jgi:hypothetical protein
MPLLRHQEFKRLLSARNSAQPLPQGSEKQKQQTGKFIYEHEESEKSVNMQIKMHLNIAIF